MIPELIFKYLDNQATEDEVLTVFRWIEESEENKKQFIALKKAWALTISGNVDCQIALQDFYNKKRKSSRSKLYHFLRYAAIVVVFICLGKTTTDSDFFSGVEQKQIVLELGNGAVQYLTPKQSKKWSDKKGDPLAQQSEDELIYQGHVPNNEVVYNSLTVPFGKTFNVTLSDGTHVQLNAGTTFKYPQQFGIDSNRKVYLTGEAFFDVAKDKLHPFIVESNHVTVEVLGTRFNLNAYQDEGEVQTVLVEGSVRLSELANNTNQSILTPNHIGIWDETSHKFAVKLVDVQLYTSWMNGELIFRDASFGTICKKMERAFDVTILNTNANLFKQKFTGTIKMKESKIEDILDLLKLDTQFKYSKKGRTIEIE